MKRGQIYFSVKHEGRLHGVLGQRVEMERVFGEPRRCARQMDVADHIPASTVASPPPEDVAMRVRLENGKDHIC